MNFDLLGSNFLDTILKNNKTTIRRGGIFNVERELNLLGHTASCNTSKEHINSKIEVIQKSSSKITNTEYVPIPLDLPIQKSSHLHICYIDSIPNILELMPILRKMYSFISGDICGIDSSLVSESSKYCDLCFYSDTDGKVVPESKAAIFHSPGEIKFRDQCFFFNKIKGLDIHGAGDIFAANFLCIAEEDLFLRAILAHDKTVKRLYEI